ncbi:hypothetical protein DUNSADRAFT_7301 [Dunaliella salina]|uniref:Encoded protein n=1 Tax=Dunaliella salina TaxID=3046 RepID=A0ABQ7GLN6_DUNSA|nr:hypothetical protein DUNSADRAFT_7301 [Dunaliella salina]|eukprot:KAF5835517.1 hypothetical protein DUNSADRAFT_7301 [Dunaliella salina]
MSTGLRTPLPLRSECPLLFVSSILNASAPRPLSLLKEQGSAHSSAASMHSAASGASTSGHEMPPLMPGRLDSQEMNIEEQKDDVFFMPMDTPGGGPTASEMSPSAPSRIRRISAQQAAPAAQRAQDARYGSSKLPKPGAGASKAAESNNIPSPHGQNRLVARNAPRCGDGNTDTFKLGGRVGSRACMFTG